MLKIILLTKRYYTNKDLMDDRFGRLFHLPKELHENGCTCVIVAADYRSAQKEYRIIDDMHFYSKPLKALALDAFLYETRNIIKRFQPDIIMASGDIHFGMLGLVYARMYGVPFVFDIYDNYMAFGTGRLPLMKQLLKYTIKKTNLVICASQPLREMIKNQNKSILVLENGVDEGLFRPCSQKTARRLLGISDMDTVIGYFGYMGANRGVETLIQASSKLVNKLPHLRLLLAGRNDLRESLNQDYIDYRGEVPQKDIPIMINAADVVVIPYVHDEQVSFSNPCKLAEYMACDVPIVATRVSDLSATLSGIPEALCDPGDSDDMARAIMYQLTTPQRVTLPVQLKWKYLGDKLTLALEQLCHSQVKVGSL